MSKNLISRTGEVRTLRLWLFAGLWLGAWSLALAADKKADKPAAKSGAKAKTPVEADEPEATADDDGIDTDESLSMLTIPPALLGKVDKINRLKFAQSMRALVLEGMAVDGAATAKRQFEAAHQTAPDDPRAAYAYGLALIEQNNPKEALPQFRAAAKQLSAPFLPALQGVAWAHLAKNERPQALAALTDLAKRLEESKGTWPTDHDKKYAAEWIGRTIGFLTGPGRSDDKAEEVTTAAADISKILTAERRQAYEHGRKAIARRHDELKAEAARPINDVLAESKQKRQDALLAAQGAEGEVKRIEEEIRSTKKPFDQQIADADREIRENGGKVKRLSSELPEAEEEVEVLSTPQMVPQVRTTGRYRMQYMTARNETAQEKKARETKLASAQQRLQQLKTSIENAKSSMTDARSKRDKARSDSRKTIADKQSALTDAKRKASEFAASAREAEHALLTPEKVKSRVTALESYVPFDPDTEKPRLLAVIKTLSAE
jgi:hypothetical protein